MNLCKKCNKIKDLNSCKNCKAIYDKEYREKNEEYQKQRHKKYDEENRQKILIRKKLYKQKNKDKLNKQAKERHYNRYHSDINYKLKHNLRVRLSNIIKFELKSGSAVKDLGCTIGELKQYLESKFQIGMNWDNYGNKKGQWSIDHIAPLSKFNLQNRDEFLIACHYTNLQPMWHIENVKKSNKINY